MEWPWGGRSAPEPDELRDVLGKVARELLDRHDWRGRPDGQVKPEVRADVLSRLDEDSSDEDVRKLLASAEENRKELDDARARAEPEFGRLEWPGLLLAGALAAFLGLFLSQMAGETSGPGTAGVGLAPWIAVILALCLGCRVTWRAWQRRRRRRDVDEAAERWRARLRDNLVRPFIVERENILAGDRLETSMAAIRIPVASYGRDPELAVTTAVMEKVIATARAIASGSIGISGPRGVGKSTILHKFDTREDPGDPEQDLRVNVAAPVDYNAREFIIHLFTELCLRVQREAPDPPLAAETRRRLDQLRFLRTYSSSWGTTLQPTVIFNLTGSFGRQKAEQPAGLPAIVADFRAYSEQVAEWNRSRGGPWAKGRVVICIDEMDKIRDSDRAEQFLNDIKAIFDVPGCLYLVAISEDALTVFASQTPAIRTAFDSAFDEIISVVPMTFTESRTLLDRRITGVQLPFIALCHVLAGGVPREFIRAIRALIHEAGAREPDVWALSRVARVLVKARCDVMCQEAILQLSRGGAAEGILLPLHRPGWPEQTPARRGRDPLEVAGRELVGAAKAAGNDEWTKMCQDVAVALSFYATVIDLFGRCPGQVAAWLEAGNYQMIDALAIARHAMRMNSEVAQALLADWRERAGCGRGNRDGGR